MAKGRVPTRDELLAFIKESSTPVGKREIARAYGIKGDQRIELKALLRDLRDTGEIAADRAKTFKDPTALTDITVLEITSVDGDGHLLATPRRRDEEKDGHAPRIEIDPHGSKGQPAPAVGDRVLASLKRRGKNAYQAKIIRHLGTGPKKILALYEEPPGSNGMGLATPTDRKMRTAFDVRPGDKNGALPGDIVWVESAGADLSRRAKVLERIGPMSDPRTVSLISIAANDIPVDFPEAAIERPKKPSPRRWATASTCAACRWSRSTARMRATSTTRCLPSRIPTTPAAGISMWRSPTSPGTCGPTGRSTVPPIAAGPRSTSRTGSCRCCPRRSATAGARCCRTRIAPCSWPRCGSTPKANCGATSSTAP